MEIRLKAYAKINLTLEVLGRRADGYHEVRTVLQTIDLADEVTLVSRDLVTLEMLPREVGPPEYNLALRAAHLLRRRAGYKNGVHIRVVKHIPEAAGLGGGSSDAAAVLVGLNRLWGSGQTGGELARLGAALGSDVPFFVYGGTAVAASRGEVVTPLRSLPQQWAVVLVPPSAVPGKTGHMYSLLTPPAFSEGERTRELAQLLQESKEWDATLLSNVFEQVAERAFPDLQAYRAALCRAGAPWVRLAGSGPALFTLLPSKAVATEVYNRAQESGHPVYIAPTVGPRDVDEFGKAAVQ